jgi:3-oxoacyl-[acyl-carrier protein] reductase
MENYELGKAWDLYGKVVVVAGGGGAKNGIGRATAILYAQLGAKIVILDINKEAAQETARQISAFATEAASVWQVDATSENEVGRAVGEIAERYGRIDVWAQIVGGHAGSTLIEDTPLALWRANIELNLTGAFICSRAILPVMKRQRQGKILLLSSMAGRGLGYTTGADYPASKAGIVTFARQLAFEAGPFNINVNAIAPGPTHEPDPEKDSKDVRLSMAPLGRLARPEDQARAIVFLSSSWAEMITGMTLDVDGGLYISNIDYNTYLSKHRNHVN